MRWQETRISHERQADQNFQHAAAAQRRTLEKNA